MIDGQEGTSSDASLETAGAAIGALLSGIEPEEKQEREAPRKPAQEAEAESTTTEDTEQSESGEQSNDDEQLEVDDQQPQKFKVRVDGQDEEVPLDELLKGYSRTADYTRKTQQLSEEKKAFSTEAEAVKGERQRYATALAQIEEVLESAQSAEPDWESLKAGDPAVFAATYAAWDQQQKQLAAVKAERARADAKVQSDKVEEHKAHLRSESERLVAAVPEWRDPEVAKTEGKQLMEYAKSKGFTPEDMAAVTDHRVFLILRDAMQHQQAIKNKPALREKIEKVRVMGPSNNSPQRREVSDLTKAKQALAKSGSLADAGAAIALMFSDDD
jgi:hypothetical protein